MVLEYDVGDDARGCKHSNEEELVDDDSGTWRNVSSSCHGKEDFKIREHMLEAFIDKILADKRLSLGETTSRVCADSTCGAFSH